MLIVYLCIVNNLKGIYKRQLIFKALKKPIMKDQKLTIVARILAKEEKGEFVKSELLKLINVTRAEEGCISYDLHQDNENPNFFIFYENWENRKLWQIHMNNKHLAEYIKATEDAVEEFIVHEMTRLA